MSTTYEEILQEMLINAREVLSMTLLLHVLIFLRSSVFRSRIIRILFCRIPRSENIWTGLLRRME